MARPEREPLLGRRGEEAQSSQQAEGSLQAAEREAEGKAEVTAQRIITWTLWLLLAAVIIGTVLGVVLVSIPLQNGDPPAAARKSAAFAVFRRAPQESDTGGQQTASGHAFFRGSAGNSTLAEPDIEVLVWSGKGHEKDLVYDDLHLFNLKTKRWQTVFEVSKEEGELRHYPVPRWKAVTLLEPETKDLIVFGGDPLGGDEVESDYLNDLWRLRLPSEFGSAEWRSINRSKDSTGAEDLPAARRAHAGVVLDVNGSSTLVVYGGRNKAGNLLTDVWATPLDSDTTQWRCLHSGESDEPEDGDLDDASLEKHHHKKRKRPEPLPRKGHIAIALPHAETPKMIIWGGRNSTAYFNDMWAFDLASEEWEQWQQGPGPSGRDHLAGFYLNGSIYIYGGRGGEKYEDSIPQGDLWSFDTATLRWSLQQTQGPTPLPRFLYSMDTYAPVGNISDTRMLIFGGETDGSCYLDDIWELSIATGTWTEKSEPVSDGRKKKKCGKITGRSLRKLLE